MTDSILLDARSHRLIASALIAGVSTVVAAAAHALAGGGSPSLAALATALVGSLVVGMIVVGSRMTHTRAAIGVVTDQVIFHSLFSFFGSGTSPTATGAHVHHTAHAPIELATSSAATLSLGAMIASHLGAAVLAYVMLRHSMGAIATAVRAVTLLVVRAWAMPSIDRSLPTPRQLRAQGQLDLPRFLTRPLLPDRRGPPLVAAV
jgi:hypothetical protein